MCRHYKKDIYMTIYQTLANIGSKLIGPEKLFKYGFNLSPMYRRSTGRIQSVSEGLSEITIKIPHSYKNKNYVGSIFGGSMFSAVDPIPMIQLMTILENKYIVWDKSAEIRFKAPAREDLYAHFVITAEEIQDIKSRLESSGELELIKKTVLTNHAKDKVYCEVSKTIYLATKAHFKEKQAKRGR